MNRKPGAPAMSQKIFSMNLDVETVSLYLLCCAVADAGAPITKRTLQEKWNGASEALERHLKRLEEKKIIDRLVEKGMEENVYLVMDEKKWR